MFGEWMRESKRNNRKGKEPGESGVEEPKEIKSNQKGEGTDLAYTRHTARTTAVGIFPAWRARHAAHT